MPIFHLIDELVFPPVEWAEEDGLLALGGDLSPERLILAYQSGIFPWYDRKPILWWSPDPRCVLFPQEAIVSDSMRKILQKGVFDITYNEDFEAVMTQCGKVPRKGQNGTWITRDMIKSYTQLHELGYAHSVEAWQNGNLVGGLYGIKVGRCFCGESMFSHTSNASKAAFLSALLQWVSEGIEIVDCQIYNPHLGSLGARQIPRKDFLPYLSKKAPPQFFAE